MSAPKSLSLMISSVSSPESFNQLQLPDRIQQQQNEIIVERTIIERSRYIIPNSQITF